MESRRQTPAYRLILTLGVAGFLSGLIIVGVYEWTRPQILAHQAESLRTAVFEVVPGATAMRPLVEAGGRWKIADEVPGEATPGSPSPGALADRNGVGPGAESGGDAGRADADRADAAGAASTGAKAGADEGEGPPTGTASTGAASTGAASTGTASTSAASNGAASTGAAGPSSATEPAKEAPRGQRAFAAFDASGALVGYAFEAEGGGFQDVIRLLYGFDPRSRQVVGMRILESRETPGLGDKIYKDLGFVSNFEALAVDPEIVLVKGEGSGSPNEVHSITGATISARAVVEIIKAAQARWEEDMPPLPGGATSDRDPAVLGDTTSNLAPAVPGDVHPAAPGDVHPGDAVPGDAHPGASGASDVHPRASVASDPHPGTSVAVDAHPGAAVPGDAAVSPGERPAASSPSVETEEEVGGGS